MRLFLLILLSIIGVIVGGSYLLQAGPAKVAYFTSPAETRNIIESVSATGSAEPLDVFYVQCETMGLVDEVMVTYNDAVQAGQPLAKVSSEMQRVRLESALADLGTSETGLLAAEAGIETARTAVRQAELQLAAARRGYSDAESQAQKDLIPKAQLDMRSDLVKAAETGVEHAQSQVKQAEAGYESAKSKKESATVGIKAANLELKKTELRAPADGIILNMNCKVGDTVGRPRLALTEPSPAIFEVARPLDKMRAVVRVNEVDYSRVRVGLPVQFTVDAYPQTRFEARVVQIRNSATNDRSSVSYDTVIEFDNKRDPQSNEWMVRPRATCRADILVRSVQNVLAVPNDALLFSPPQGQVEIPAVETGQQLVWVESKDSSISPRKIKTGITDGFFTEIVSGDLEAGENIVIGAPASSEGIKLPTFGP
ncbi:HlyD family efflux transporter periplasmic adaptor subunit [bacterium]|nr:HlyD family efflux transporter periplasmic adaptor subunit [bacterium]